jgi:hypothetical protein
MHFSQDEGIIFLVLYSVVIVLAFYCQLMYLAQPSSPKMCTKLFDERSPN